MAACVRVGSPQEAQIAISQLHRKKLGYKRILISNKYVDKEFTNLWSKSFIFPLQSNPQFQPEHVEVQGWSCVGRSSEWSTSGGMQSLQDKEVFVHFFL